MRFIPSAPSASSLRSLCPSGAQVPKVLDCLFPITLTKMGNDGVRTVLGAVWPHFLAAATRLVCEKYRDDAELVLSLPKY